MIHKYNLFERHKDATGYGGLGYHKRSLTGGMLRSLPERIEQAQYLQDQRAIESNIAPRSLVASRLGTTKSQLTPSLSRGPLQYFVEQAEIERHIRDQLMSEEEEYEEGSMDSEEFDRISEMINQEEEIIIAQQAHQRATERAIQAREDRLRQQVEEAVDDEEEDFSEEEEDEEELRYTLPEKDDEIPPGQEEWYKDWSESWAPRHTNHNAGGLEPDMNNNMSSVDLVEELEREEEKDAEGITRPGLEYLLQRVKVQVWDPVSYSNKKVFKMKWVKNGEVYEPKGVKKNEVAVKPKEERVIVKPKIEQPKYEMTKQEFDEKIISLPDRLLPTGLIHNKPIRDLIVNAIRRSASDVGYERAFMDAFISEKVKEMMNIHNFRERINYGDAFEKYAVTLGKAYALKILGQNVNIENNNANPNLKYKSGKEIIYYKDRNGERISKYCPIDLYSIAGDLELKGWGAFFEQDRGIVKGHSYYELKDNNKTVNMQLTKFKGFDAYGIKFTPYYIEVGNNVLFYNTYMEFEDFTTKQQIKKWLYSPEYKPRPLKFMVQFIEGIYEYDATGDLDKIGYSPANIKGKNGEQLLNFDPTTTLYKTNVMTMTGEANKGIAIDINKWKRVIV
jgi:hypothetical protein